MTEAKTTSDWRSHVYTSTGQRQLLLAILTIGMLIPVLFVEYLDPLVWLFPVVTIGGIILVRRGKPESIPTWVTFNCISFFLLVYAAYAIGTTLTTELVLLFLCGLMVYDIIGVQTGGMQSLNKSMLTTGIPIVLLMPHTPQFRYDAFTSIIETEGHEGLHGSDHGVMLLGIGDAVLPAALGIAAGGYGTVSTIGQLSATLPQVGAVVGGLVGLAILLWANLPRAIAALTVSVPGAVTGFALGMFIDPTTSITALSFV